MIKEIKFTDNAIKQINHLLSSKDKGSFFRIAIKGGGCSGFKYVWGLMYDSPDVKWSEPIDNVLVVDPLAELYILGSEIDYVTELGGSFLAVKNPTSTSSCGCGESFGV